MITEGPFTLFAPVNDAFKKLPEESVAKLTATPTELKKFLLRHVVKGNIPLSELKTGDLTSLEGGISKITVSAPGIYYFLLDLPHSLDYKHKFPSNEGE